MATNLLTHDNLDLNTRDLLTSISWGNGRNVVLLVCVYVCVLCLCIYVCVYHICANFLLLAWPVAARFVCVQCVCSVFVRV